MQFHIRCPSCWHWWIEPWRMPVDRASRQTVCSCCPACDQLISIDFGYDEYGGQTVASVTDYETMEEGDFAPLLTDQEVS